MNDYFDTPTKLSLNTLVMIGADCGGGCGGSGGDGSGGDEDLIGETCRREGLDRHLQVEKQ